MVDDYRIVGGLQISVIRMIIDFCLSLKKSGLFAPNPLFPAGGTATRQAKNQAGNVFRLRDFLQRLTLGEKKGLLVIKNPPFTIESRIGYVK